jgi:purine-binding chemotaxis protein CheW
MGATNPSDTHVVIVVVLAERLIGVLVDAVSDILTIDASEILTIPETDASATIDFLAGLVSVKEGMAAILLPDKLFAGFGATSAFN